MGAAVVACGYAAPVLGAAEGILDAVALPIQGLVVKGPEPSVHSKKTIDGRSV